MPQPINPATEEMLESVADHTPEQIAEFYKKARAAQPSWAAKTFDDRATIVKEFRRLLEERADELAKILSTEMGKPVSQARGEILATPKRIDFFLDQTEALMATDVVFREAPDTVVSLDETASSDTDPELTAVEESAETNPEMEAVPEKKVEEEPSNLLSTRTDFKIPTDLLAPPIRNEEKISYDPLGVVGNISAWNYPYFVGSNVFIPALLTGSVVLYKPSEYTTQTGLAIGKLWKEAGLPEDVFTVIVGGGEAGKALLEQPLNGIFFTGSHATGCKVAAAAASRLIPVQLELGGKDPSYVCDDAPIQETAEALSDGAFYNTGQSCCSVERIYVHQSIYEEFVEAFVKIVKGFVVGDPADKDTYIGPLARKEQIAILEAQVADALAKGAKLECGGKAMDRTGYYFEPTVLSNVDHSMDVMREESFGPIIGIQSVDNDKQALALMNDTRYGLTAGVYTPSQERALDMLDKLNAGSTYWNCCDRISPRLPWSGRQDSGLGVTLSHLGIRAFLKPKAWHLTNPFLTS